MNFITYLQNRQKRVNDKLDELLLVAEEEIAGASKLHQAMRYSILNGGKRLRPIFVYATGETFNASLELLDTPACAIEFIHGFSLIHDDLPAMDNDDFRRGKPTCHKAFGEATAILAGDALQTLAYQIIAEKCCGATETKVAMAKVLAAESMRMVYGQVVDIDEPNDISQLENMYMLKTGALIRASIKLGALASGIINDAEKITQLEKFADCLGLAYQIQDDIFDIAETEGKNKITYPALVGVAASKAKIEALYQQAIAALQNLHVDSSLLFALAKYVMTRKY
ncbi:unnamed protein product [marine sediment metagenome]|uniref:Geranyltranstransferase n=1 Tax=marine sediment metagenome TaxID=412755 RepID=X0ZEG6_9ZZZZ